MKNGPVIVFISSEGNITGNDVTYDVIIKFNRVHHNPPRNNPVKIHQDRIRFSQVILFKKAQRATGNDVTDNVIKKFNRLHSYPPRNNHVKFHQDRIRFSQGLKAQSAILPEMTSLMTSSQQNSIGFILTHEGTIL